MNASQELLDRGLHYYGIGELRRAAELWLELLSQDPDNREAAKYIDYLKGQKPELFGDLKPRPTGSYRQPVSASRLDWASSVPVGPQDAPPVARAAPVAKAAPVAPSKGAGVPGLAPPVGDPFDLLAPNVQRPTKNPLLDGALDLFKLNDFEGALELLGKAERQGLVDPRIGPTRLDCEAQLLKLYEARLGDLRKAPKTKVASGDLMWLNLDHRAGFVLSLVDGQVSYEELFSLSGMSRLDTARLLAALVREGVIGS